MHFSSSNTMDDEQVLLPVSISSRSESAARALDTTTRHQRTRPPAIKERSLTQGGASAAYGELRPGALGPASRLRRRYADAPAGAPRCAPSAPAEARRRVPPASQSGLLAAFIFAMRLAPLTPCCRPIGLLGS